MRLYPLLWLALLPACGARQPAKVASPTAGDCPRASPYEPVMLPGARFDARHGAAAKTFAELNTTLARPVETCGLADELYTLLRYTCDDGSSPFGTDPRVAHASRAGNAGAGGRCGSIIDLYVVPCPEARYAVYMDMYVCNADAPAPR